MVFVEVFTDFESIGEAELSGMIAKLPSWRAEKAIKFHHLIDRKLCAIGYNLLQKILLNLYGISENQDWAYEENGKPYLPNHREIFFNISHCKAGVACAVSNSSIGIDIESVGPIDYSLANYISNEQELKEITNSDNPAVALTMLWTKKESYLKLSGTPMPNNPKLILENIANNVEFEIKITDSYVLTICRKL